MFSVCLWADVVVVVFVNKVNFLVVGLDVVGVVVMCEVWFLDIAVLIAFFCVICGHCCSCSWVAVSVVVVIVVLVVVVV